MKLFYFTIAFIFILIFSIVYFINNFTTKSNISIEELLSNQNLQIDVETDEYGLNTIHFQNEDDFYYLLGIFQSKDRLWQLDYLRRRAEGRLSEVLGEDYIQYDKFIRCFDLKIISKNQYNNLTPNAKHVIDKYTDGVNHFINNNYNNLSIEFNYLGYKPEKWKGSDCIKILLLNSIEQNEVIPIFLKKAKYYNLTNKINNKLSNNIDSISFTKKQKDDMFNHFYNNFIKNKQFENTLNYFSLSSTYNNDYLWQINLNNSIDSNNINKPNNLINNNTEYISFIKNDVLSVLNQVYPIKSVCKNNIYFHFTLPGVPLSNLSFVNNKDVINNYSFYNFNTDIKNFFGYDIKNNLITNNVVNDTTLKYNYSNYGVTYNNKINYEIDTISIKNLPRLQFYKRSIENKQVKSKVRIVSDYLVDKKNNHIKNLDFSNEKNSYNFYFEFEGFSLINNVFEKYDKFNKNSNNYIKTNDLSFSSKINQQNYYNSNEIDNYIVNQREILNSEINYSKNLLINSEISDVMLQQNLYENEINKTIIALIIHSYYNYQSEYNDEEKELISELFIKNSKNFQYYKKFQLDKKFNKQFDAKTIQNYFIENLQNNLVLNFYNYEYKFREFKNELIEDKVLKKYFISKLLNQLDSNKKNDINNYTILNLTNSKEKIIKSIKKCIYSLDNYSKTNYQSQIFVKHPMGNNFLKYNSLIKTSKIGDIGSIKYIQEKNVLNKNIPIGQSYKCILDKKDNTLYYVLFGGISSDISNINYRDQLILWEKGGYCKVPLNK